MYNSVLTKFTSYWTPYLHFFKVKYRSVICITTEVPTVGNMKNVIFWDISSWFLTGITIGLSCREDWGSKFLQNVTVQYTIVMLSLHIHQSFHFLCTPHFSDRNFIGLYILRLSQEVALPSLLIFLELVILFHLVAVQIIKSFICEYSPNLRYILYFYPYHF